MKQLTAALLLLFLSVNTVQAADVTKGARAGSTGPDNTDGGYLELGLGVFNVDRDRTKKVDNKPGLAVNISGAYRFKGFFIEASQGAMDGISLGYNVWDGSNWTVDIIGVNAVGEASGGDSEPDYTTLSDEQRIQAIDDREQLYSGAGISLTGFFGNAIVQYRLLTDTIDNNGIRSAARLGYSWQIKNWNFYSVLQADYNSRKTNRYWHAVTEEQASSRYPAYDLGSTIAYSGEIGVTYPLSENIVFRTTARSFQLPDAIANSPLKFDASRTIFTTMISYVF